MSSFGTVTDNLFGVIHVVVGGQPEQLSFIGKAWPIFLYLLDSIQILSLTVDTAYGWPKDWSAISGILSIDRHVPFAKGKNWFYLVSSLALLLVLSIVFLILYALYVFKSSEIRRMWPIRLLRLLVQLSTTALYVPIISLMFRLISCRQLDTIYDVSHFACWSVEHSTMATVSAIGLLVFLPLSLIMAATLNDSSPTSPHPNAKVNGVSSFYYTFVRTVMVFCSIFASSNLVANSLFFGTLLCSVAVLIGYKLPYYHLYANSLRCSILGELSMINFTTAILASIRDSSWDIRLSVVWLGVLISLSTAAVAAYVPRLRFRYVCRQIIAYSKVYSGKNGHYGNNVPETVDDLGVTRGSLDKMPAARNSGTVSNSFTLSLNGNGKDNNRNSDKLTPVKPRFDLEDPHSISISLSNNKPSFEDDEAEQTRSLRRGSFRDRPSSPTLSSSSASTNRGRRDQYERDGQNGRGNSNRGAPVEPVEPVEPQDWPSFSYLTVSDVELYVRAAVILDMKSRVADRHSSVRPSDEAVCLMHNIFRDGLGFYRNRGDIHFVYSLYIQTFTSLPFDAVVERKISQSCTQLDILTKFQIFSTERDFATRQASTGLHKGMDSVGMIEYKNLLQSAFASQLQALEATEVFWSMVSKRKSTAMDISGQLKSIDEARKKALQSFDSLLRKYPSSVEVLRAYATFLIDVMDDNETARDYISKADILEKEQSKVRSADYQSEAASSHVSSSSGYVSWKTTQRRSQEGESAIERIGLKMIISIFLIIVSLSASFAYSSVAIDSLQSSITNLNSAGLRRGATSTVGLGTRLLQIGVANDNDEWITLGMDLVTDSSNGLKKLHQDVYMKDKSLGSMASFDISPVWDMKVPTINLTGSLVPEVQKVSLWDYGNHYVEEAVLLRTQDLDGLEEPEAQQNFLFLMWNTYNLIETYEVSMAKLETHVFDEAFLSEIITICLVALVMCCVIGMALIVFRPALKGVERSMSNINDIMGYIPRSTVKQMKRTYSQRVQTERSRQNRDTTMNDNNSILDFHEKDTASAGSPRSSKRRGNSKPTGRKFSMVSNPNDSELGIPHHGSEDSLLSFDQGSLVALSPGLSPLPSPRNCGNRSPASPNARRKVSFSVEIPRPVVEEKELERSESEGYDAPSISPKREDSEDQLFPDTKNNMYDPSSRASVENGEIELDGLEKKVKEDEDDDALISSLKNPNAEVVLDVEKLAVTLDDIEKAKNAEGSDHSDVGAARAKFDASASTRKFTIRLSLVCLIILAAGSVLTVMCVFSLRNGKFLSADLNNAGRRRYLSAQLAQTGIDCLVNDEVDVTRQECVSRLQVKSRFLFDVHTGLQVGNSSMNLNGVDGRDPAQDYLMYKEPCMAPKKAICDGVRADITYGAGPVSQGYDFMMKTFLRQCDLVIDHMQYMIHTENNTQSYELDYVTSLDPLNFLRTVSTRDMAWGSAASAALMQAEVVSVFDNFRVLTAGVYSATIVVLLLVYIVLLRPLAALLKSETTRQWDLLELIPEEVILEEPELTAYFNLSTDDLRGKMANKRIN